jgi:hypothetical protein
MMMVATKNGWYSFDSEHWRHFTAGQMLDETDCILRVTTWWFHDTW